MKTFNTIAWRPPIQPIIEIALVEGSALLKSADGTIYRAWIDWPTEPMLSIEILERP